MDCGCVIKITIEVSDDLYRRAKSEAALRGRKLKDLVEEGLRLVLETQRVRAIIVSRNWWNAHAESWIPASPTWRPIQNTSRLSAAMRRAIVDTGPLVAFLDRAEQHHPWVIERIDELQAPLLVWSRLLWQADQKDKAPATNNYSLLTIAERTQFVDPAATAQVFKRSGIQAARGRTSRAIASPLSMRALLRSCMACRFIQNSGLVPKKRAKRRAVSAVTARSLLTMAPMRVAGTRKAIAKALTDIPSGLRNSSLSTSPGWAVTRLGVAIALVVIDDFDIGRSFFGPSKADAPLIIDPDRILSSTTAGQRPLSPSTVTRHRASVRY
jgi:hypothetical protein